MADVRYVTRDEINAIRAAMGKDAWFDAQRAAYCKGLEDRFYEGAYAEVDGVVLKPKEMQ